MSGEALIGVDIGTTKTKAGAFALDGRLLSRRECGYSLRRPRPAWAEQDPEDYVATVEQVVRGLLEEVDPRAVVAVGICSQVNTHVFLDRRGRPLGPAITWQDQRCAAAAADLTGPDVAIDASSLLARTEWMRRAEPERWRRTRWVMSPKDYVNLRLTGTAATDPLSSIGLVGDDGGYRELDGLVAGVGRVLPPLGDLGSTVGVTTGGVLGLPAGVPLAIGTMDAWSSLYGSGAVDDGQAFEVAGTSEILGVLASDGPGAAGVVAFPPYDGIRLFAGPTQAGGDALRWYAESCGSDHHAVLAQAERSAPGSGGVVFLPHLMGERAPLWDADLRGAFAGIDGGHGQPELARAVLEGVAYSARHLLEALEAAAGAPVERLAISGGAAASDLWCQIKADVLGRPLARLRVLDSGLLGAALMAGVAGLRLTGLRAGARALVHEERVFEPRPELAAGYDAGYAFYRDVQRALTPVMLAHRDRLRAP